MARLALSEKGGFLLFGRKMQGVERSRSRCKGRQPSTYASHWQPLLLLFYIPSRRQPSLSSIESSVAKDGGEVHSVTVALSRHRVKDLNESRRLISATRAESTPHASSGSGMPGDSIGAVYTVRIRISSHLLSNRARKGPGPIPLRLAIHPILARPD